VNKRSKSYAFFTRTVRHQIELERYNAGVVRKMLALLARADEDLVTSIRALDPESLTRVALEQRLDAIRAQQEALGERLKTQLNADATEIAVYSAKAAQGIAEAAIGVAWNGVTKEQVRAAALSRPFQGVHLRFALLDEHADELSKRRAALVRDTIRKGFLEGRGVDDIVRQIRGSRVQGYRDGLLETGRRTVETITRTALTHTANAAREEVYKVNATSIKKVQWVSVIDARTSSICRTYDGQLFDMDKGPRPPAHPNCRSTTVPVFKGDAPIERKTYAEWLGEQSAETQAEILGERKAKLFRDGGLPIDRFTNETGKEYTLTELETRDRAAWKRSE
jgi:SPP1 gp7 family putative phage head morphogenesis protein